VDWLLLASLGIMWVAFLIPAPRRQRSAHVSVGDFERGMELLAQVDMHGHSGRWIVTPRKGTRFLGHVERKRARARERRRNVFVFLIESIGITFLIGLVPPLRIFWKLSLGIGALLVVYVWLLLWIKHASRRHARETRPHVGAGSALALPRLRDTRAAVSTRYVAEGPNTHARATINGLNSLDEGDHVHVVVRRAGLAGA
jgi:hypothetical protein